MRKKNKSVEEEQATAQHVSICIQAQQFKPGINNLQTDEQALVNAKASAENLTPEEQAQLIRHLEQNLYKQFTPGMTNPHLAGRERFPFLVDWYLERCLNRYVNQVCEDVKKNEEVECTNLSLIGDRQALTFVLLLSAYSMKGVLSDKEVHRILIFAYGLLPIFLRAHVANEDARQQLAAIQKMIYAESYGIQVTDFEKVLGRKRTFDAQLARGMEISKLLGDISWLVKRADGLRFVAKNDDLVKLTDDHDLISFKKDLVEKVTKHLLLQPTLSLENLAISIYNESINDGSGGKDLKKLKADLRAYEKWRARNHSPNTLGHKYGCDLPTEEYTIGWRERKPGSGGLRSKKMKSGKP